MSGYIDIKCPNYDNGCRFDIISQEEYTIHLGECEFTLATCPNACGKRVLKKNLDRHLIEICPKRRAICLYCKKELVYDGLTEHQRHCDEKMITCHFCGVFGFRKGKIEEHYSSCPMKTKPCSMKFLGCKAELRSQEMEEHESNTNEHFPLVVQKLKALQSHLFERDKSVEQLEAENRDLIKRLKMAERKIEDLRCEFFIEGGLQRSDSQENMKNSSSSNQLKNIQLRDNNKWRIHGFEAIKKKGYKGIWTNELYCTKERGYVFGLRIHISKVIGLFISLYPGDYDEELSWPFPHTVQFSLLNQRDNVPVKICEFSEKTVPEEFKSCFEQPVGRENKKVGVTNALTMSDLDNPDNGYIKSDSFVVIIDVAD